MTRRQPDELPDLRRDDPRPARGTVEPRPPRSPQLGMSDAEVVHDLAAARS